MGGRDKVLAAATEALTKKEYAWAAQLVNYLYRLDPQDKQVRKIKAEALRQMAYVSTGANDRAHLMSQALALEGKVQIPRLIPPAPEAIIASPTTYVDYFRVRIDPKKSGETDKVLRFDFAKGTSVGLHVRRAIAEFVPSPDKYHRKPDVTLAMAEETWVKLYVSSGNARRPDQERGDQGHRQCGRGGSLDRPVRPLCAREGRCCAAGRILFSEVTKTSRDEASKNVAESTSTHQHGLKPYGSDYLLDHKLNLSRNS